MVYKIKIVSNNEIIVCDVMKSLTIYKYDELKKIFTVKLRYPNGQWCFDSIQIDDGYLSSDFNKNLAYLMDNDDEERKNLLSLTA